MATSRPKSGTLGKERRGTSPSPNTTKKTTITKQYTSSAPKPTSPPSDKPSSVPHYLKPTISSRLDSSSNSLKKPAHGAHDQDAANKALLLRRRSFDRPPPSSPSTTTTTSRVHKALVSPGPRERMAASRSSSFSHKSVAAPKPSSERSLKTPTWGKSRSLNAKSSVRKTPSPAIKKESKAAAASSSSSNVVELKKEDEEVLIPEIGEIIETAEIGEIIEAAEREMENLSEVLPNSEDFLGTQVKINGGQDEEHKYCSDISTVSEEQNAPEAAQNEEIEVQVEEKGINVEHREEEDENLGKNKRNPGDQIESTVETVADDNIEEENAKENPEIEKSIENSGDHENKLEEKEEVHDEENEKEKAAVEDAKEAKAKEGENAVAGKKEGGGQETPSSAKKESPAYNDVIEETASKLLEKRKNKVKALVGAFETVISLQEPEP